MNKIRITATDDISNEVITFLKEDVGKDMIEKSTSHISLNNIDPPSFIEIVGTIFSWENIFKAPVGIFFVTIAKN